VIPEEDEKQLLEASVFMDQNECNTVISAAREPASSYEEMVKHLEQASANFKKAAIEKFGGQKQQEW
jgi:hypothetical protein